MIVHYGFDQLKIENFGIKILFKKEFSQIDLSWSNGQNFKEDTNLLKMGLAIAVKFPDLFSTCHPDWTPMLVLLLRPLWLIVIDFFHLKILKVANRWGIHGWDSRETGTLEYDLDRSVRKTLSYLKMFSVMEVFSEWSRPREYDWSRVQTEIQANDNKKEIKNTSIFFTAYHMQHMTICKSYKALRKRWE